MHMQVRVVHPEPERGPVALPRLRALGWQQQQLEQETRDVQVASTVEHQGRGDHF